MATPFPFTVFAHDNPILFTGLVLRYCLKTFPEAGLKPDKPA